MRKAYLLLSGLLIATSGMAQITAGTITYDESIHLDVELSAEMAQFSSFLPKEIHSNAMLLFSANTSIYQQTAPPATSGNNGDGGEDQPTVVMQMKNGGQDNIVFNDLNAGVAVEQADLFGRTFLIKEAVRKRTWHRTGQQKKLLGFECQQAFCADAEDTVIAWFTTAIPVAMGPKDLNGLPGMILEAVCKNGKSMVTITATKIEEGVAGRKIPVAPGKGKKVTRDEYQKIVASKTKELEEQYGGSGNTMIRIMN